MCQVADAASRKGQGGVEGDGADEQNEMFGPDRKDEPEENLAVGEQQTVGEQHPVQGTRGSDCRDKARGCQEGDEDPGPDPAHREL